MTTWAEFLEEQLKDPEFKKEYDALEGWYQEELARQRALNRESITMPTSTVKIDNNSPHSAYA